MIHFARFFAFRWRADQRRLAKTYGLMGGRKRSLRERRRRA